MRAGKLDKRVILQTPAGTDDGYGQPGEAWTDVASTWVGIRPLRGQELISAKQRVGESTHAVTMRYRPGVMVKMRLVYGSRYLNIVDVLDPNEAHEMLDILCKEMVPQ